MPINSNNNNFFPANEDSDSEVPQDYSGVTLAPDDAEILDVYGLRKVRTNTFGLGYAGLSRENILGRREEEGGSGAFRVSKEKKTFTVKGQVSCGTIRLKNRSLLCCKIVVTRKLYI